MSIVRKGKGAVDDEHKAERKEAVDNAQKTARGQEEEQDDSSYSMSGILFFDDDLDRMSTSCQEHKKYCAITGRNRLVKGEGDS